MTIREQADELIEKYGDSAAWYAVAFRDGDKIHVYDDDDDLVGYFTDQEFIDWMTDTGRT